MELVVERVGSPVGPIVLVSREDVVCLLEFEDNETRWRPLLERRFGPVMLRDAGRQSDATARVAAYLAGDLHAIDDVPADLGGTPFQARVWAELRRIPAGRTISYGEQARRLGQPGAMRAVGLANGRNPVSIIVPCHRVIGANGSLTGYGGGIERKRWLLRHEGAAFEDATAQHGLFEAA